jgi:hypothetical protein
VRRAREGAKVVAANIVEERLRTSGRRASGARLVRVPGDIATEDGAPGDREPCRYLLSDDASDVTAP